MTTESQPLLKRPHRERPLSTCCGDNLWALKVMYLVSNMALSAYCNYLAVFYEDSVHYSKFQIGILQALPCLGTIVGPPLWCAVADKYQAHRAALVVSIVSGTIAVYAILFSRSFPVTLTLVLLASFLNASTPPLIDHAVLDVLSKHPGEYGKQRMYGSLGYGVGAYVAGLVVALTGIAGAFSVSVACSLASLFVLRQIPVIYHTMGEHSQSSAEPVGAETQQQHKTSFADAMRQVARKGDVIVLLVVVFLMSLMYGVLTSFLTLNFYELSGQNAQIVGIAILCETLSEAPAFFFSQTLIDRFGVVKVMLFAITGYAVRITYYAFMTNAWSALPFEFLHGLSYGVAWAVATEYLYASAPVGSQGTMIGLLNAVQEGAGRGAGTLLGGYLYQHYGTRTMWLVTDLGVPLSLIGVAAFGYLKKQAEAEQQERDTLDAADRVLASVVAR